LRDSASALSQLSQPEQLGTLEIINRTNDILRIILMVGLATTALRFYQEKEEQAYGKAVFSTAMVFLVIFSLILLTVLMFFAKPFKPAYGHSRALRLYPYFAIHSVFSKLLFYHAYPLLPGAAAVKHLYSHLAGAFLFAV
jgi:O-antigen/teichoic acid export membrane protein